MLKKLKSVSKTHALTSWPQILKAFVFSVLLILANQGGIFWTLIFLTASFHFYFKPNAEWKKFFYTFLIITFYSFAVIQFLENDLIGILAAFALGFFFFLFLGIKDFVFIKRASVFNFLTGFLYFLVSVVFFTVDKSNPLNFFVYFVIAFIAYYGLFKELLDFSYPDFPKSKRSLIIASSAFLIMELVSAVSLLPIGFLNSSALILLFIFILEDFIFYHLKGGLNRQVILNNVTILIVAVIFIFATSRWAL